MSSMNLKTLLSDTMRVKFDFYRNGELWYSTINGFQFPVPISGLHSSAVLKANDTAKAFEYWIKKQFNQKKD